jgi:hypothetical protein
VALSALRRLPPAPFGFRFVVRAGGGRGVSAFVSRERLAERPGRPRLVAVDATSLLLLADCEARKQCQRGIDDMCTTGVCERLLAAKQHAHGRNEHAKHDNNAQGEILALWQTGQGGGLCGNASGQKNMATRIAVESAGQQQAALHRQSRTLVAGSGVIACDDASLLECGLSIVRQLDGSSMARGWDMLLSFCRR